jgi:hypothetical protein
MLTLYILVMTCGDGPGGGCSRPIANGQTVPVVRASPVAVMTLQLIGAEVGASTSRRHKTLSGATFRHQRRCAVRSKQRLRARPRRQQRVTA